MGIMERFWEKVEKKPDGCWEWKAGKDKDGYGGFSVCRKKTRAHRFIYEATYGPIPPYTSKGFELDHVICSNPGCVNPEHMRLVTQKANVLRGESPSAKNARQTHCKYGHALIHDNLRKRKDERRCIICARSSDRLLKEKMRNENREVVNARQRKYRRRDPEKWRAYDRARRPRKNV
jgi:hypothetical protein